MKENKYKNLSVIQDAYIWITLYRLYYKFGILSACSVVHYSTKWLTDSEKIP